MFKKLVTRSIFGKDLLMLILLNFKIFCCNLKDNQEVWEQNCVWLFYYFNFERNYDVLKVKNSMYFVEQTYKL